ncbi:DUF445 domain-containing protein [bacterium]|nr:DUF445 domain-containing protein [bacterium]
MTALFRHPLRLPIPHIAIIPKRNDQIGRSLGDFVESNFLTAEVRDERLHGAEIGRRTGEWLADPTHAERAGEALADVVHGGLEVLDLTIEGGHHQRLLDTILLGVGGFLDDNRGTFRRRLDEESPW